jgi:hypothetical protein
MKLEHTWFQPARVVAARALLAQLPLLCCSLVACLDHPDAEVVGYSPYVLAPDAEVRPLERDQDAQKKLDLNDGLGTEVLLRTGNFNDQDVWYWDLGQSPMSAEPMWVLVEGPIGRGAPITDHPPIIDSIPGDTAYSPMRIIFDVHVTEKYQGERIPSQRALDDAIELGLVRDPQLSGYFTNCVVTLEAVTFESGFDMPPLHPTSAYYRDLEVFQFCVMRNYDDGSTMPAEFTLKSEAVYFGNAFGLRRENTTAALDEPAAKRDLNGDGDMLDVNVVFDVQPDDDGYSSLWKGFEVVMASDYAFGAVESFDNLFEREPGSMSAKPPAIEYRDTMQIWNRPIRAVVTP